MLISNFGLVTSEKGIGKKKIIIYYFYKMYCKIESEMYGILQKWTVKVKSDFLKSLYNQRMQNWM